MALTGLAAIAFVTVLVGVQPCAGTSFRGGKLENIGVMHPDVQRLIFEVENHFGRNNIQHRVAKLELLFRGVYDSLPKNRDGRLDASGVRYCLHRVFSQRHGWLVEGLDANGGAWNESSPIAVLDGRVPAYLQGLFEELLGDQGFGLEELALVGASLENLVRIETMSRITFSYQGLGLYTDSELTAKQVERVLELDFMVYLFASDSKNLTASISYFQSKYLQVENGYPGWRDTAAFLQDEQGNLAYVEKHIHNPFVQKGFDFTSVLHASEAISDAYGQFQDLECYDMKNVLLVHEYKGTGRVLLRDFYGLARAGDWRYSETKDYLRQLGALDESEPEHPSVIVPNYMYGKSMCLASSSYYSVCCLNECDRILGRLEQSFAMPAAKPEALAVKVAHLSSSTVSAPRNLSSGLRERLFEIAAQHGGLVPLHGRLFAQFLHHAYPRECPFPHTSGTTNPLTSAQWRTKANVSVSAEQAKQLGSVIAGGARHASLDDIDAEDAMDEGWDETLPWTSDEELVVHFEPDASKAGDYWVWMRAGCMVAVMATMMRVFFQTGRTARASGNAPSAKVFV